MYLLSIAVGTGSTDSSPVFISVLILLETRLRDRNRIRDDLRVRKLQVNSIDVPRSPRVWRRPNAKPEAGEAVDPPGLLGRDAVLVPSSAPHSCPACTVSMPKTEQLQQSASMYPLGCDRNSTHVIQKRATMIGSVVDAAVEASPRLFLRSEVYEDMLNCRV